MGFQRPSRFVALATAASSIVLAAGGFFLGSRTDDKLIPDSVLVQPAEPGSPGDPIMVPDRVKLPKA